MQPSRACKTTMQPRLANTIHKQRRNTQRANTKQYQATRVSETRASPCNQTNNRSTAGRAHPKHAASRTEMRPSTQCRLIHSMTPCVMLWAGLRLQELNMQLAKHPKHDLATTLPSMVRCQQRSGWFGNAITCNRVMPNMC